MNGQVTATPAIKFHQRGEATHRTIDRDRCADVAVEFNRLFILRGDDLAYTFREFLLEEILRLTDSEFGYIAEVLHAPDHPYLKVFGYALTDISWDEATRELYADQLEKGLEFHNLDSIWGEGVRTGTPVISNSESDTRRSGTPPGHPSIRSFMGLPLFVNGELRAQIGLANRPGGYEDEWPAALEPIVDACGTAMVVACARRDQAEYTANLQKSRDLMATQQAEMTELLRVRDAFMASVVHELRTPMAAMSVYARLLQSDTEAGSELRDYSDALSRNADRLAALMEDIILTASTPGNPVTLNRSEEDMEGIVRRAIGDCVTAIPASAREYTTIPTVSTEGKEPFTASIDVLRFSQALNNVVSNAMKYAPQASISITLRNAEDHLEIEVQDRGPGMSADDVRRCRVPFYRGTGAARAITGGVGLGLSIADQMITAHGGEMRIESTLGEGTTVTLLIPR